MDKVFGTVDIMVGKMTHNEDKVREGQEKKDGASATTRDERKQEEEDHPGIKYTKSGAMKQVCLVRPPSPSSSTSPASATDVVDHNTEIHPDPTATRYQHRDYAGPDLTSPPPEHYHPHHDLEPEYLGGGGTGYDSGGRAAGEVVGGGEGQGARGYDLHGGFPTGAPSPGIRRSAEVLDPFDQMQVSRSGTGTIVEAGPGRRA